MLGLALLPLALGAANLPAQLGPNDVAQQFQRWERRLRAKVIQLHTFPGAVERHSTGDVVISFSIGPDGRPTDAVIRQSSGNQVFDRSARRVVRLLGPIGPVPTLTGGTHRVLLKLSYGEAATADADRELAYALETEREAHSRRNLEIVTMAADGTVDADRAPSAR